MGFDKYVPWIVFGVVAYFIVTKTTILQNFASGLKNLGSGGGSTSGDSGGGGQTAQAQPQNAPAASTPSSTTSAPAPATTVQAPKAIPTVTAIGKQAGAVAPRAPRKGNAANSGKKKQPRNAGTVAAAPPPGGALTTGSGRTLASTLTNAQMIAMGISSAGCPAGGASSGGKHCYTLPGRHHCCPGKPSPPGSPSNAPGQSKCDCDA